MGAEAMERRHGRGFSFKLKVRQSDPAELRQKHAAYMKNYRKSSTEEQRDRNRQTSKLRMQRYRDRLREQTEELRLAKKNGQSSRKTRQQERKEEERKRKQTLYKREYRRSLSSQKKRRTREKDAASKRKQREAKRSTEKKNAPSSSTTSPMSSEALRKAVYRAKQNLPKSPHRYGKIVSRLVKSATPKKKKVLHSEGIESPTAKKRLNEVLDVIKDAHEGLKGKSKKKRMERKVLVRSLAQGVKKKYGLQQFMCRATGVQKKYLRKGCMTKTKKRKDCMPVNIVQSIQDFYKEVSACVPNKKCLRDLQEKYVMRTSMSSAYSVWKEENPEMSSSFSTFCKLRPKNVLPQKQKKLFQCLCEYCENTKLKLQAVNKLADKKGQKELKFKNELEVIEQTLCGKEEGAKFHKLECVDRRCKNCGTDTLAGALRQIEADDEVSWKVWKLVKRQNPKTGDEVCRRELVTESGPSSELFAEFIDEIGFLSKHLFEAKWQVLQVSELTKNIQPNTLAVIVDFAENYKCFSQQEVQGAHWSKDSVTVHPGIAYYHCPADGELVEEAIDIVSDDLNHDCHAVHAFLKAIFQHVQVTRGLIINHAYIVSDGCGAQYKSKTPFADVSFSNEDFGFSVERVYYGSRHGKNRCDGEGGVVKVAATRAVKNETVLIRHAREFASFCEKALEKPAVDQDGKCMHKRRKILWVGKASITRSRPERNFKTVPGTRKIHSVLGVKIGTIKTRRLSCFCYACRTTNVAFCSNKSYVNNWKTICMKAQPSTAHSQPVPNQPTATPHQPTATPHQPTATPHQPTASAYLPEPPLPHLPSSSSQPAISSRSSSSHLEQQMPPCKQRTTMPTTTPPVLTSQADPHLWTVNSCVVVRYPDRCYPGIIVEVHEDHQHVTVKFLQPHRRHRGRFTFPEMDDVQTVHISMIVQSISLLPQGSSCREWIVPDFNWD